MVLQNDVHKRQRVHIGNKLALAYSRQSTHLAYYAPARRARGIKR